MITESDYQHHEIKGCQWITTMGLMEAEKCPKRREYGKPYCIQHCNLAYQPFVCEPVEQAGAK